MKHSHKYEEWATEPDSLLDGIDYYSLAIMGLWAFYLIVVASK